MSDWGITTKVAADVLEPIALTTCTCSSGPTVKAVEKAGFAAALTAKRYDVGFLGEE